MKSWPEITNPTQQKARKQDATYTNRKIFGNTKHIYFIFSDYSKAPEHSLGIHMEKKCIETRQSK